MLEGLERIRDAQETAWCQVQNPLHLMSEKKSQVFIHLMPHLATSTHEMQKNCNVRREKVYTYREFALPTCSAPAEPVMPTQYHVIHKVL